MGLGSTFPGQIWVGLDVPDQTSGNELPDLEWGSIPWPINLADYLGLPNLPSLNLGGTNGDGSDFDFNFPDFEFHSMDSDLDFDFDSIFNGLFSGMSGASRFMVLTELPCAAFNSFNDWAILEFKGRSPRILPCWILAARPFVAVSSDFGT